jgi:hypothetical protein
LANLVLEPAFGISSQDLESVPVESLTIGDGYIEATGVDLGAIMGEESPE